MLLLWGYEPRLGKEFGRSLEVDSGTLSPLLKRLEAAGLVRRERRATGERAVEVTLTPEGRALQGRAWHIPRAKEQATSLSNEEIEDFRDRSIACAPPCTGHYPSRPRNRNEAGRGLAVVVPQVNLDRRWYLCAR